MPRHSRSSSHSKSQGSRSRSRSSSPEVEGVRVHVGELPVQCSERELEHIFKKYGPLVEVWMARVPPCFAFIVFRDREDAEEAIKAMNGRTICGRRVRVSIARPRVEARGPRPAPSYNARDARCYQCGDRGHLSRNCYVYRSRRNHSPRRHRHSPSLEKSVSRSRSRSRSHGRKSKKGDKSREKSHDVDSGEERSRDRRSREKGTKDKESGRRRRDEDIKSPKKEKEARSDSAKTNDQEVRTVMAGSSKTAELNENNSS